MEKNLNPLVKTIVNSIGKQARIIYKLGSWEETIITEILDISDSHLSVIVAHPEPFYNTSINTMHFKGDGTYSIASKLVTTQMIPINNILAFRLHDKS